MRVSLNDIPGELRVAVKGDEPWLARIYADFPLTADGTARLTGGLRLVREEAGSVRVTGRLSYAPAVACSRCERAIAWPLDIELDARCQPPPTTQQPRERNLTAAELEVYYFVDQAVDVEELVNDAVQTALPTRFLRYADDGESCRVCGDDLAEPRVYGTGEADESTGDKGGKTSPFAALKGLKLPN